MKIQDILQPKYDVDRLDKAKKGLARYGDDFYRTHAVLELLVKLMREKPASPKIIDIVDSLPWKAKSFILKNIISVNPDGSINSLFNPASLERPKQDNKIKMPSLVERADNNFFGMSERHFYGLLSGWYASENPKVRDKFLLVDWGKTTEVPSEVIYRGIKIKFNKVEKLLRTGLPIVLNPRYLTSSWTVKKSVASKWDNIDNNYVSLCIKKNVKKKNVVLYTPNLYKIPAIKDLILDADTTLRETLYGGGWEKEVIIKNDQYYLTIELKDIVSIGGMSISDFKESFDII